MLLAFFAEALRLGVVGLFTKLAPREVESQETRARILDLLRREDGLHFSEIARRLDLRQTTALYHVTYLVKTGYLSKQKRNGYACYFPTGRRDRREMPAATVLVAPGAKALLDAALARPGATLAELEAATGFSRGTTRHHLERFQREGLLRTEMVAGRWQVYPTELGRERGGAAA